MKLNKLFFKTAVSAVLLSLTGAALAGSVTTPATDAASYKYATEGLTAPAAITLPAVVYTLGVSRAVGQNFTFIVTPSAGSLDPTTCTGSPGGVWIGSAGLTTATKRASATECALDVTVTAATAVGATITGTGIKFTATPLATAGSSITFNVALKDPGETSFIDNSGSVTRVVATGINAINIYAWESDTRTITNVNDPNGPLRGFIATAGGACAPSDNDSITTAKAWWRLNSMARSFSCSDVSPRVNVILEFVCVPAIGCG